MKKRAAIYVWVRSTQDSPTVNEQLAACRVYLQKRKYHIYSQTVDECDRRLRKQLLRGVCARELTVCVLSLDRLANSVHGMLMTIERLYDSGCELISVSDKIDTTESVGFAHLLAMRNLVKYRRTEIQSEATSRKYVRRPYGYNYDRPTDQLTPIPAEQEIIQRIVAMFERERLTPAQIIKEMNKTTPPPMAACRWHIKQIQRILERESDEY